LVLCALLCVSGCGKRSVKEQPLEYSHAAHVGKGLPCELCHATVASEAFAGIPSIETCMTCHQGKITESAQEEKLRRIAEAGGALDWQPIFQLPTHVYFSHRRHVTIAGLECRTCHGNLQESTVLPGIAPIDMNMKFCVRCHEERRASVDCISCHQ